MNLLDMLSSLRKLLRYDRKLKNAVAKSFIDMLDKHGIVITFKPLHGTGTRHEFEIAEICAKKQVSLGAQGKDGKVSGVSGEDSRPVELWARSEDYVKMVRALLEYGRPKSG